MRLDIFPVGRPPELVGTSKPTAPLVTSRWERLRPAIHIGVLLLVLAGTAVLAIEAYLSHQSYAERARAASHDLAFEAGANLSRWAEQRLIYNQMLYFTPVPSRESYDTPKRRASFSEMALAPAKEGCESGMCPAGPARTTFHFDLRTGSWETTGAPIDSAAARLIRDSISDEALHRYQKAWELAVLAVPSGGQTHLVFYRVAWDSAGKPAAVNGLELDMPRVAREMFSRTLSQGALLASAQTHGRPNNALFSVRVVTKDGTEYLEAGPKADVAPTIAEYSKGEGGFGPYLVQIGLSPVLRAEAASGREDTRFVRTLLAFAASVILIVIAIAQTRRENTLARLRESFVASVSHELRTPLAQIRLYSEMLQMGFVRNQSEHIAAVQVIVHEAGRLTYLIENVLTYSRASRHELRLEVSPVDVEGVLTELTRTVGPLASTAGVAFRTDADHGLVVTADRAALLQVLVNLIDNAVRHGTGGTQVVLSARRTGSTVQFLIDDCGPGVPRRDRERIWRRFVRLEGRTRSTGSGIGLSVVAELVQGMNGRVWVTVSPMGGARFVVELPRESDTPAPELEPQLAQR